mgnify:CR=1 FL=1
MKKELGLLVDVVKIRDELITLLQGNVSELNVNIKLIKSLTNELGNKLEDYNDTVKEVV